tara:strand:- start:1095 stop:1511 length:417 start_codon:yes stop_codon:yes gene_type:complete
MASILKVNTFTGASTAGSIAVTGEGNSTTTNLQQGLVKCWINYTGISTTAERDSFNVTSLTDEGTGKTTITIANDMANANYSGYYYTNADANTAYTNFANGHTGGFGGFATGSFKNNAYSSTDVDSFQNLSGILGDLA